MDALEDFVGLLKPLTAWTKYIDVVSMLMKSLRFFPDAPVEGNWEIFDNNQDLLLGHYDVKSYIGGIGKARPTPMASDSAALEDGAGIVLCISGMVAPSVF
jgi:hypothetical protein